MKRPPHRNFRRRGIALLGVFAILFQAALFGWHHHELRLPAPQAGAALLAAAGTAAPSPAAAEDDCEICQALHHLAAAPGLFAALPAPPAAPSTVAPPAAPSAANAAPHGFQARAPPRA